MWTADNLHENQDVFSLKNSNNKTDLICYNTIQIHCKIVADSTNISWEADDSY